MFRRFLTQQKNGKQFFLNQNNILLKNSKTTFRTDNRLVSLIYYFFINVLFNLKMREKKETKKITNHWLRFNLTFAHDIERKVHYGLAGSVHKPQGSWLLFVFSTVKLHHQCKHVNVTQSILLTALDKGLFQTLLLS